MSTTALDKHFLFVVGAPRSGTTWVHRMLATHPAVAAMEQEELTVFTRYAGTWTRNYAAEQRDIDEGRWRQGLPALMSAADLDAHLRPFIADVYGRVLAKNPTATHVLDKHPNYANHLHVIERFLPRARIIHVIRDGREVAVSMMSVHRRVGHSPGEVGAAAKEWHRCVTNAMNAAARLGPERYLEVRYEKLMADTAAELTRLFTFAGLAMEPAAIEKVAAEHHISRRQVSSGDTRNNALRATAGAIWKDRLTLAQRHRFEAIAGPLLQRLGYARPGWWALSAADRLRMLPHGFIVRVKRSIDALRRIWSGPVEERLP